MAATRLHLPSPVRTKMSTPTRLLCLRVFLFFLSSHLHTMSPMSITQPILLRWEHVMAFCRPVPSEGTQWNPSQCFLRIFCHSSLLSDTCTPTYARCHLGKSIIYDTVTNASWAVDIRTHVIVAIIEKLLSKPWPPSQEIGREVPEPIAEDDCIVSRVFLVISPVLFILMIIL